MSIVLTILGMIPFVLFSVLSIVGGSGSIDWGAMLAAYAGMICAFLAGTHWGVVMSQHLTAVWFVHSNGIALLTWVGLVLSRLYSLPIFMVCLLYSLGIDTYFWWQSIIDDRYFLLRVIATVVVCMSLLVAWFFV